VSRKLTSKVTDTVNEELAAWQNRRLDRVYKVTPLAHAAAPAAIATSTRATFVA